MSPPYPTSYLAGFDRMDLEVREHLLLHPSERQDQVA